MLKINRKIWILTLLMWIIFGTGCVIPLPPSDNNTMFWVVCLIKMMLWGGAGVTLGLRDIILVKLNKPVDLSR